MGKNLINDSNTGKKLTKEVALERILEKCKEKNYEFLGFKNEENEYENGRTKLILKCLNCGNIWDSTDYGHFVRGNRGCSNCNKFTKPLDKKEVIKEIEKLCQERDFTFLGFAEEYYGLHTHLLLKCNKCGEEWDTTTVSNLKKIDRKSHTCSRNGNYRPPKEVILERYKNKLKNPNLEILGFKEDIFINPTKNHLIIKCHNCGIEFTYSCSKFCEHQGDIKCKHCERNLKRSHEEALQMVLDKCKLLDYTFLGFKTDDEKYYNKSTKLILKCNKCERVWDTTNFHNFINGTMKCLGCYSFKLEKEIEVALKEKNIEYEFQKRFNWLGLKTLDFYLPKYNIAIECQGRQHFESVEAFGGEDAFNGQHERDILKNQLCKENNVKLLYYSTYKKSDTFLNEKVFKNNKEIIKEIKKYE